MLIGDRRHGWKQGENGRVVSRSQGNENKLLTWWYKLLTKGRHIAGMKPRVKIASDETEIDVCHLV
jgi:hypothetical protein